MENYKIQDRNAIIAFLEKAKDGAFMTEIIEGSGANKLRVDPILTELYLEERLEVLEQTEWGGFIKVRLISTVS